MHSPSDTHKQAPINGHAASLEKDGWYVCDCGSLACWMA